MRKAILILCVAALLVSVAGAAMASSTYWIVKFKTGAYDGTNYTGYGSVTIGAGTTSSYAPATDPASTAANIATHPDATWYGTERRLSSTSPLPQTWTLTQAVGTDYAAAAGHAGQVYISAWSPDKYSSTTGRGLPAGWQVKVQNAAETITYATWTQAQLATLVDPSPATAAGPVGFWFTYSGQSNTWAGPTTDAFHVTVFVPEPGSLLALGSGLIGLAGFAIRRRR